jgi:hypothetical protein
MIRLISYDSSLSKRNLLLEHLLPLGYLQSFQRTWSVLTSSGQKRAAKLHPFFYPTNFLSNFFEKNLLLKKKGNKINTFYPVLQIFPAFLKELYQKEGAKLVTFLD